MTPLLSSQTVTKASVPIMKNSKEFKISKKAFERRPSEPISRSALNLRTQSSRSTRWS